MPADPPGEPAAGEAVVARWIDAVNGGDVDGGLACLDPHVVFHPLRLGADGACHGHDGVRAWFEGHERLARRHRIALAEIRHPAAPELLAVGTLSYPGEPGASPFCGAYRLARGLIVVAHHYLSDADTVERILGPALRGSPPHR